MKMLLSLVLVLCSCFLSVPAKAALSNSNNPHSLCVPLGSPSADAVVLSGALYKQVVVDAVYLLNAASVSASDTDYLKLELKKGATVVAELDTRAAHENGLTLNTVEPLNIVSAQSTIAAQAVLSVNYDETDTGTNVALTGAVLCMNYTVK